MIALLIDIFPSQVLARLSSRQAIIAGAWIDRTNGPDTMRCRDPACANRMVLLDDGQIVEVNEPAAFFGHPQHERTKLFLSQILR